MVKRELYIRRIRPFIGNDLVKVLTGIRRAGKSVMLELIKEELRSSGVTDEHFISYNFESLSNSELCNYQNLYEALKKRASLIQGKAYLFLDEIQEVTEWERCINSIRVDLDCDIYITGSNAKLLSGELATYIGGRYVEFVIYPFSFAEYLESRKENEKNADVTSAFREYIVNGGMPFLTNLHDNREASIQYLRDLYNSVILKDVVMRNKIRDADILDRIINYVMANTGHTFSARSISNYFKSEGRKVSTETILNYMKACCDAFLIYRVNREDIAGKKILSVNEKYYIADQGIREAVYGNNTRDIDQILENIVCMELLRRGYNVMIGKNRDKEIDFIAEKSGNRIYVQVTYLLAAETTREREFGAYAGIADNYPKYVISMDDINMSQNGIIHYNIRDFLLLEQW